MSPRLRPLCLAVAAIVAATLFATEAAKDPLAEDRVGLPADYAKTFEVVRRFNGAQRSKAVTVYANPAAGATRDVSKLPYADGSIFVVAWAEPVKDANGKPVVDAEGLWQPGEVTQVDVMRREKGFGEKYGEHRTGEWEFASYRGGTTSWLKPSDALDCAKCHHKAEARDFVFRGRFPAMGN
jgi:hypothetical protein